MLSLKLIFVFPIREQIARGREYTRLYRARIRGTHTACCRGKRGFVLNQEVEISKQELIEKRLCRNPDLLEIYCCRFCLHWHVGHKTIHGSLNVGVEGGARLQQSRPACQQFAVFRFRRASDIVTGRATPLELLGQQKCPGSPQSGHFTVRFKSQQIAVVPFRGPSDNLFVGQL